MATRLEECVIEAAGGIVERHAPEGLRIAVIRRERYGSEWSLPKGKRQAGESWQETALREVEEEIGLRAVITGVAGATAYLAGTVPKLVLYWRMSTNSELPLFTPNEEVAQVRWLTPDDALRQLTHAEEIDLVMRSYKGSS